MGGLLPIIIIGIIAYIIFKPKNEEKTNKDNGQSQEIKINHSNKRGDDVSVGFFSALGEKLGSASGCFVIVLIILIIFIIIALSGIREIGRAFNVIPWLNFLHKNKK